jgi:3-methyladenine DNA glycosylase AlkD
VSLWATGNGDARVLATLVVDPARMTDAGVDAWLADCDSYPLVDALVTHVAQRMPDLASRAERWITSDRDRTAQAGWQLLSAFAASDVDTDDAYFEGQLTTIEQRMTSYGNWTRRAANGAIINIGLRDPALEAAARATASRMGHVDFDPGMTGCVMPDPIAYIERVKARRSAMLEV